MPLLCQRGMQGVLTFKAIAFETGSGESDSIATENTQPAVIEAQGWIVNERGKVELIASSANDANVGQENFNCDR